MQEVEHQLGLVYLLQKLQEEKGYTSIGVGSQNFGETQTRDERDLEIRLQTLDDLGQQLYNLYLQENPDADKEKVMEFLQKKYTDEQRKKEWEDFWGVDVAKNIQPSSSQYLIDQARKRNQGLGITNPWMNMPGVQVASTGNLTGMGIPNALQHMHAGNLALNQTPARVAASQPVSGGGGRDVWEQGNRQAEKEQRQQSVQQERAKYKDTATTGAKAGFKYGLQKGGVVSLMDLLNRRV